MDDNELKAEVQNLADQMEANARARARAEQRQIEIGDYAIVIQIALSAAWDVMQRALPGQLNEAKAKYRNALRSHLKAVEKLRQN